MALLCEPPINTSPCTPIWNMAGSRKSSRNTSAPPGLYELSASRPCFQGKSQESSYEPGDSDVVRELSREPAMFQIGVQGNVLNLTWAMANGGGQNISWFPP